MVGPKNSSFARLCKYVQLSPQGRIILYNCNVEDKLSTIKELWLRCYVKVVIWAKMLDLGMSLNQISPPPPLEEKM